jgi:hypothetical protein
MKESQKICFGDLDKVFPMGKEGLREVPQHCFGCNEKNACLQKALSTKKGIDLKSELLERTPYTGVVGWLKRWSEKKVLTQRTKQKEGRRK